MAAPRICCRVTASALEGLDDRRLVLGAQGALDGEQLRVVRLYCAAYLADFLSEQGQRLSYAADFLDNHLLPGSQSLALVKPIIDQRGKLLGEDSMVNMRQYAAESARTEREFMRILAKQ